MGKTCKLSFYIKKYYGPQAYKIFKLTSNKEYKLRLVFGQNAVTETRFTRIPETTK